MAKGVKSVKTANGCKPKVREQTLRDDLISESLLTIQEVCLILRVGPSTLEELHGDGVLLKGHIRRSVRYLREDVLAYRDSLFRRDSTR